MGADVFAGGDSSSGSAGFGSSGSGNIGTYTGAAGDLFSGLAAFAGASATGHKLKDTAKRVANATQLRLRQQEQAGFRVQGQALADVGFSGGTVGGSAESILRANAMNLAMDHGILQAQGSEEEAKLRAAASASFMSGWGSLISGVVSGATKAATA